MDLWMYIFIVAMFVVALAASVVMTIWTIQRGRAKANQLPPLEPLVVDDDEELEPANDEPARSEG